MRDVSEPVLAGYVSCRKCGGLVLEHLAFQTHGICWTCFTKLPTVVRANQLEVQMEGVISRLTGRKTSPPKRAPLGKYNREKETARYAAFRRLSRRHHEEFHLLWQEERIRRGIPPALSAEMNILATAVKTIDDRLRYLRYIPGDDDHADQPKDA